MTSLVNRVGVDTLDDLTFAASTISSNLRRAAAVRSIDSGTVVSLVRYRGRKSSRSNVAKPRSKR